MKNMFNYATDFNQPLAHFVTSKVTDMGQMFVFTTNFDQDISNWDAVRVTKYDNMLCHSKYSHNLPTHLQLSIAKKNCMP